MRAVAIFLCDLTGIMGRPWAEAGYDVILVDPQHNVCSEDWLDNGATIYRYPFTILEAGNALSRIVRNRCVLFVAGFPPCTDVSVSGAKHFAAKREKDIHFQAKAALVAEQCRMVGMLSGAPWFFENPVSVFSSIFGPPDHTFSPDKYTGYCAAKRYAVRVFNCGLSCERTVTKLHELMGWRQPDELEADIERPAIEYAESRGWFHYKIMRASKKAIPDDYFLRRGRHIHIEFKRPGKDATTQQAKRHREMREHGAEVFVVDSLEAAKRILR